MENSRDSTPKGSQILAPDRAAHPGLQVVSRIRPTSEGSQILAPDRAVHPGLQVVSRIRPTPKGSQILAPDRAAHPGLRLDGETMTPEGSQRAATPPGSRLIVLNAPGVALRLPPANLSDPFGVKSNTPLACHALRALLFFSTLLCSFSAVVAGPPAAPRPSGEQIQRWISLLGDKDYFVRQKAELELMKTGFAAVDALTEAADSDDLEVVARSERLLRAIKSNWASPGDPPEVAQLLQSYEAQEDEGREQKVAALIALAKHEGAAAVCRAICYDRSPVVAKSAAVRLMESFGIEKVKPALAAEIRKQLADCRRSSARWVLAWLDVARDPPALAAFWTKIALEEDGLFADRPRETSPAVVEKILQIQIASLRAANRSGEAADSVRRLMKLHHGEPAALAKLIHWLTEQKDWPAMRLVEKQFQKPIAASSELLYLVAEAQVLRGDSAAAEESAAAALKLNPENDERALQAHLQAGWELEDRCRAEWAIREWEYVVRTAPRESQVAIRTASLLSELYHDLDRDEQAAATILKVEKSLAARTDQFRLLGNYESLSLGELRARRFYFEACRWREQGDRAKQKAALDKALATQSYDIEVLIECYRLPARTPIIARTPAS